VFDIITGRTALNSDPYFNTAGLDWGYIALVDSGIRQTHQLLDSNISWVRDCVNGTTNNCATAGPGLTLDPSDVINHGTGVASIMSGDTALGNNTRGVTDIRFDSFKATTPGGSMDGGGVTRGFQAAVAGGSNVVNGSFLCGAGSTVCTTAADAAFDAGLVVVVCAGNQGGAFITPPGDAKKAITVGALHPTTLAKTNYSNIGPGLAGRTKPDLMAVSGGDVAADYLTLASSASDSALRHGWGTSFASPFVAGGAGLLSRWLKISFGSSTNIEPGQTNAMLLAAGQNFSSPSSNGSIGAGNLSLPTNATLYGGKVTVSTGSSVDVPFSVAAGVTNLDVAIWWPEASNVTSDIDLRLMTPAGTQAASSLYTKSVWEKVHKATTTSGTWNVRITGYSATSQVVHWAAIRR
jgi:hypothetical protein